MQIILRDDMDNLGKSGEVVNVKPGYARNFLLPRGHAIKATESDVKRVEHEKRVIAARTAKLAKEAQAEADKLSQISVSIARIDEKSGDRQRENTRQRTLQCRRLRCRRSWCPMCSWSISGSRSAVCSSGVRS